jgi:hypothetical protein
MQRYPEILIRIHRQWDGWHSGEVRLADVDDVHWFQPTEAPHALLHAFVRCTDIVSGAIPHDCDAESRPHRLLVCILKRHTISTAYADLARRADERLVDRATSQRVAGFARSG